MVDFVKDGQVGDEVYDPRHGNGTIVRIKNYNCNYPLLVDFEQYGEFLYTCLGVSITCMMLPTLCFGHREVEQIDQGQPPERYQVCKDHTITGSKGVTIIKGSVFKVLVRDSCSFLDAGFVVRKL